VHLGTLPVLADQRWLWTITSIVAAQMDSLDSEPSRGW